MAIEETKYLDYAEAVLIHIRLMQVLGENRYGVDSRDLIDSALARPRHAAIYENADIIRQSATLLFGLIKNHPWLGGNKRTATTLLQDFLKKTAIVKIGQLPNKSNWFWQLKPTLGILTKSKLGCVKELAGFKNRAMFEKL